MFNVKIAQSVGRLSQVVIRSYDDINKVTYFITNIQLRIKQNEFVSGHFVWNMWNYYLAQNIDVGLVPKMIFSFEAFSFIFSVKIFYCLFQVQ